MTIAKKLTKGLACVGLGSLASLISGVYTKDLTRLGAHITGYGFPLSWLEKTTIVVPDRPTSYSLSLEGLLIDIVFWALLIGVLYEGYRWYKSRK